MSQEHFHYYLIREIAWESSPWSPELSAQYPQYREEPLSKLGSSCRIFRDRARADEVCRQLNLDALLSLPERKVALDIHDVFGWDTPVDVYVSQSDPNDHEVWRPEFISPSMAETLLEHLKTPFFQVDSLTLE